MHTRKIPKLNGKVMYACVCDAQRFKNWLRLEERDTCLMHRMMHKTLT